MTLAIDVPVGEMLLIRGRLYERVFNPFGRSEAYNTRPSFHMVHAPCELLHLPWHTSGELVGMSIPYDGGDR